MNAVCERMTTPTADDEEKLSITFDTPTPYHSLQEWLDYRAWLVAQFGERPIGASYIRTADETIAAIRARGELRL